MVEQLLTIFQQHGREVDLVEQPCADGLLRDVGSYARLCPASARNTPG
jgi:hypothetical protein